MSDPIQMPASAAAVARIAPVRPEPAIEPAKPPQTENRSSDKKHENEQQAASSANAAANRRLTITRDETLKSFVYRSIDDDSGEVVWQWPAEDMLRRAQHLRQLEEKRREEAHAVDEKA